MTAITGKVEIVPLARVSPNGWNPNRMEAHVYASLRHALQTEGWLASQALLVWGTDEKGVARNLIIDGEHRWTVARELGFKECPMVFLTGLAEARAKALTVAMNNRRGRFDEALLADLVRSLDGALDNMGLDLAIDEEDLSRLLAIEPVEETLGIAASDSAKARAPASAVPEMVSTVRMVNLFFDTATVEQFSEIVADLGKRYGTKNITDTVMEAVRRERGAIP